MRFTFMSKKVEKYRKKSSFQKRIIDLPHMETWKTKFVLFFYSVVKFFEIKIAV